MKRSPVPARASRTQDYSVQTDIEDDDAYYPQRMPSTARRYYTTDGNQVVQQGNRRIVIHEGPPPKKSGHGLLFIGIGMVAMIALWFLVQAASLWWTNEQLNAAYQYPRISQAD